MIQWHYHQVIISKRYPLWLSMNLANLHTWQEILHTMSTKRNHYFWLNNLQLLEKVRPKLLFFFRQRIAVVWRPVFYDIRNIDIIPHHPCLCKHFIEKLPTRAHKWQSLLIFTLPWRLADKNDIGIWVSITHHKIRSLVCKLQTCPVF